MIILRRTSMRTSGDWVLKLFFFVLAIVMVYCLWIAPLKGWQ